ncbi:MAG: hypothetical protein JW927_01550 [Deltaproteobacteria bacterium]|nr:hypothetical protein [Deltaproteobacteria bacterium]
MIIDSSVVINNPGEGEFKVRKKDGPDKIKPVEKSGGSEEAKLNNNRDKITEKNPDTRRFDTGTLYNKYGEPDRDDNAGAKPKPIDVVV